MSGGAGTPSTRLLGGAAERLFNYSAGANIDSSVALDGLTLDVRVGVVEIDMAKKPLLDQPGGERAPAGMNWCSRSGRRRAVRCRRNAP